MSSLDESEKRVVDKIKNSMALSDREICVSDKFIFIMYHKSGLNTDDFADQLTSILKKDVVKSIDKKIAIYDELIRKAKRLRKAVVHDLLIGDKDD